VSSAPKRIQLRRTKGWRMPEGVVSVARPTKWGNPWKPGDTYRGTFKIADLRHAFVLYRAEAPMNLSLVAAAQRELRGKTLACWCPPHQSCHADVLLELANRPLRCEPAKADRT
jgi:hypothetical protein